jgi:hypothetical protein
MSHLSWILIVIFGSVMQKSKYSQITQEFCKQVICFASCCFSSEFLRFQQTFHRNICAFSFEASLNLCDWQNYRLNHFKDRAFNFLFRSFCDFYILFMRLSISLMTSCLLIRRFSLILFVYFASCPNDILHLS